MFDGWTGNDLLDGRGGFDQALYNSNGLTISGISVDMVTGQVVGDATIGTDTLRSIEQVFGTNSADTYIATNFGEAAFTDTSLYNVGSNGTFNSFQGNGGNDTITGNGNTQIAFFNAAAGVTVNLAGGTAFSTLAGDAAGIGIDTITGGVNNVQGSNLDNSITGGSGNEFLSGGTGNDTINGGSGSDTITGGAGNDTIDGGAGGDMAVYAGTIGQYTVTSGSVSGNGEGTDTLSNIEVLHFGAGTIAPAYYLVASGTSGIPVDVVGLNFIGTAGLSSLTGNTNDFVTIGQNFFGRPIDLGAGNADTVNLGIAGAGYTLALVGVENLNGAGGDEFVSLANNANGLAVDLGAGTNDFLTLTGTNSVSVANVENVSGSDFGLNLGDPVVNDTLTLLNNVSGVTVNLGNGINALNLAAGANTFVAIYSVGNINGSSGNDTLSITDNFYNNGNPIIFNLGGGNDTLNIGTQYANFSVVGVELINGNGGDNWFSIGSNLNGTAVDLGGGNDNLFLTGTNSVSVANVEYINGNDFNVGVSSDDTISLLNSVAGVNVNLGNGTNTLNLAAGINSLTGVFDVQSINGSASSDTLTLGQVGGQTGVTRVDLGAGNDTLNLSLNSFGITFVYADNDGADVVSGFARDRGDKIDLTGVSGIHGFADVQAISSQSGGNSIIDFGNGNSLQLTGIIATDLVAEDFLFGTPQSTIQWISGLSGNWNTASNWSAGVLPGAQDDVLINPAVNVTFDSGSSTINRLTTSASTNLTIAGGTMAIAANSSIGGSLSISAGVLTANGVMTAGNFTFSGGLLTGTGTFTVSGLSTLSGGRESGSGTTIAQGGAAFSTTSFSLDGGRTLQLGGTSTAIGTDVRIFFNGGTDPGSGILTIANGATFNDQTTSSGLSIFTQNSRWHRRRQQRGSEQSWHLYQERQRDHLDHQHDVQQHRNGGSRTAARSTSRAER